MVKRVKHVPGSGPERDVLDLVPHPRYGTAVVPSGCTATAEDIRSSFYGYSDRTIYPESAILADFSRQNFTTFPRGYYVDMLAVCRTCARPFLFFAREQKYWYEDLHFYIDTDCVHCSACRAASHEHRDRLRRYAEHVGRDDLDLNQLAILVGDAVFLWQAGTLHDEQKLRWLRNLARRRIPQDRATASIDRLIAGLDPAPR